MYVIGYLHIVEGVDYPERYDVFVIALSLMDALDNADIYVAHDGDIVHSVMCHAPPPMSNLRFTTAVRYKLAPTPPRAGTKP